MQGVPGSNPAQEARVYKSFFFNLLMFLQLITCPSVVEHWLRNEELLKKSNLFFFSVFYYCSLNKITLTSCPTDMEGFAQIRH